MRAAFAAMIISACVIVAAAAPTSRHAYETGQVWRYLARSEDPSSLLRIAAIEAADEKAIGAVYHISITGVHLEISGETTVIGHLPVSQETLDSSVIELTKSDDIFPDITDSVKQWRAAHGGVFTIPVAQIVGLAATRVNGH